MSNHKVRLFNVVKSIIHKTPNATASLEAHASKMLLEDGIKCPVCHHLYGDKDGFHQPCEHLAAHFGPFGWEHAPHEAVECLKGVAAFRVIETLAMQGNDVIKVTSGEYADNDWIVWQKPAKSATMAA